MSESDRDRKKRLVEAIHHGSKPLASELARLADGLWTEDDAALSHQPYLDALPYFVRAEVMGEPVATRFPELKHHLDRCDSCARQYIELLQLMLAEASDQVSAPATTPQFDFSFLPLKRVPPSSERGSRLAEKIGALVQQLQDTILTWQVGLAGDMTTGRLGQGQAARELLETYRIGGRAARGEMEQGQTPDGVLRWTITEDEERNLVIRLFSAELELVGLDLRVQAGDWQQDATLISVTGDQVAADLFLPRSEREQLAPDTPLRIAVKSA